MKMHILAPALILMGAWATGASAQATMLRPTAHAGVVKAAAESTLQTLVDEDFSRMSAGTEATPDETYIADRQTGSIPSKYTRTPGWSGACIYQAGGTCAIRKGLFSNGMGGAVEETGFLRTPQGAYSGNVTLTFRARLLGSDKASDKMDVAILSENGRLETQYVDVTSEWKSYTLNFTKGGFSGCVMQFTMAQEEVLIDDIEVTTRQTKIPAPVATEVTDYIPGGFTAHWQGTNQADSYTVTIYEKKVSEAITVEDFEGLNLIAGTNLLNSSDPGFPEGWQFAYGTVRNADHVSPLGYEGSTGMIFRNTGEGFVTPTFERPIRDFSFYAAHPSGEECLSTLVVSVLVDGQWGALGNYDVERISDEGEIINLSSNFPDGVKAIQVYFRKNDQYDAGKDVSVVFDHICIMTEPEGVAVRTGLETPELSYSVAGLDPEKDYSFTVRAKNASFESDESNEVSAAGLPAPEILSASDLTVDGYTANWASTPKAEGYAVSNYSVYTVSDASETVNVLYENFDKVTEGTLESPVGLYNVVNPRSLDDYTMNPGWMGIANYLVKGMMGSRAYMNITGCIQTPTMDLSGNGGKFTVTVTVVGDTDATNDQLVVQAGYASFIRQDIKPGEPVTLTYEFTCGQPNMQLLLYTYNGYPFYIDEITVTQTLPRGSKVYTLVENRVLADKDAHSATFAGLRLGDNLNYAYGVYAYRDFMGARQYSASNGLKDVYLSSGIDNIEADASEGEAVYYRIDGRQLHSAPSTPGVYIRRTDKGAEKILVK